MRYYLSGPMSGQPRRGFPAFFEAAYALRQLGLGIVSPVELTLKLAGLTYPASEFEWGETLERLAAIPRERFLAQDTVAVAEADGIILLPGWETSEGARYELGIAKTLGKDILTWDGEKLHDLELQGAARIVNEPADPVEALREGPGWQEQAAEYDQRYQEESGAVKADGQKVRLELLPSKPLLGIAEILTFGAAKYADHNWRKGFRWSRMYGALQRHLVAWADGEDLDPESGKPHLWHAGCDLLFLAEYEATGTGTDDRYKKEIS